MIDVDEMWDRMFNEKAPADVAESLHNFQEHGKQFADPSLVLMLMVLHKYLLRLNASSRAWMPALEGLMQQIVFATNYAERCQRVAEQAHERMNELADKVANMERRIDRLVHGTPLYWRGWRVDYPLLVGKVTIICLAISMIVVIFALI